MINKDDFLKNPDKFGDVVILSSEDYEKYDAYQEMLLAEAEADAGDVVTKEEFFQFVDEYAANWKAKHK